MANFCKKKKKFFILDVKRNAFALYMVEKTELDSSIMLKKYKFIIIKNYIKNKLTIVFTKNENNEKGSFC